jgi:hypothetical protein
MTVHLKIFHSLFLSLLAIAIPATASVYVAQNTDEMVANSDAVIEGHVLAISSHWNSEKTAIVTDARIQVDDSIVGTLADVVTVRVIGGQVGKIRTEAEGSPTFKKDQSMLLFLHQRGDGTYGIYSEQLGQFLIESDPSGNKSAVPALSSEVHLLTRKGGIARRPSSLPIQDFKNQIREASARVGKTH